jgi:hypothetical protein
LCLRGRKKNETTSAQLMGKEVHERTELHSSPLKWNTPSSKLCIFRKTGKNKPHLDRALCCMARNDVVDYCLTSIYSVNYLALFSVFSEIRKRTFQFVLETSLAQFCIKQGILVLLTFVISIQIHNFILEFVFISSCLPQTVFFRTFLYLKYQSRCLLDFRP